MITSGREAAHLCLHGSAPVAELQRGGRPRFIWYNPSVVPSPRHEPVEPPGLDGAELASQPPRLAGDQVQPDQSWTVEPHLLPAQAVGREKVGEQIRRYGLRDGALQAITQGGGENYLSAFGLLLHASAFQIGLLSALPQLVGTWAQLLSVKAFHRFRHRKTAILAGSIGQAAMWLPLLAMPLLFPSKGPGS